MKNENDPLDANIRRVLAAADAPTPLSTDRVNAIGRRVATQLDGGLSAPPPNPRRWLPHLAVLAGMVLMGVAGHSVFAAVTDSPGQRSEFGGIVAGGSMMAYVAMALSATGPLASRAFLPLFIICLCAAYPDAAASLIPYSIDVPPALTFMTRPEFITVLGILAFLECFAEKNNEIKEFLDELAKGAKAAVSIVVALALVPPTSVGSALVEAGYSGPTLFALSCGGLTYLLADIRSRFYNWTRELDGDDAVGIRAGLSWLEDLVTTGGIMLCIILPIATVFLVGALLSIVALVSWLSNRYTQRHRYPCPDCRYRVLPTALECAGCGYTLQPQMVLNWHLWHRRQHLEEISDCDRNSHALRLLSQHKCPACAERVKARDFVKNGCPHCQYGFTVAEQEQWFNNYLGHVLERAHWALLPVAAVGAIPVLGFSVAVVVTKLVLVSPLMIFLNMRQRMGLRWGLRLMTLLLLIPSCIPFLSLISVPFLLYFHILVYSHFARRNLTTVLQPAPA